MLDLRQRALNLLARREHSRAELAAKLAIHGSADDIEPVLNDLQRSGLLSDARAAGAFLRSQSARFGIARLRQRLRARGIAAELIDRELQAADLVPELERARAVWARKFAGPPVDRREWARQARFLQSRGFTADIIRNLLHEPRP